MVICGVFCVEYRSQRVLCGCFVWIIEAKVLHVRCFFVALQYDMYFQNSAVETPAAYFINMDHLNPNMDK